MGGGGGGCGGGGGGFGLEGDDERLRFGSTGSHERWGGHDFGAMRREIETGGVNFSEEFGELGVCHVYLSSYLICWT